MKQEVEIHANPAGKIFFKLAVLGCFLLGFAYFSMLLMNTALKALH
jgi:hypothetical protein